MNDSRWFYAYVICQRLHKPRSTAHPCELLQHAHGVVSRGKYQRAQRPDQTAADAQSISRVFLVCNIKTADGSTYDLISFDRLLDS